MFLGFFVTVALTEGYHLHLKGWMDNPGHASADCKAFSCLVSSCRTGGQSRQAS